jgi:hypothetical protein
MSLIRRLLPLSSFLPEAQGQVETGGRVYQSGTPGASAEKDWPLELPPALDSQTFDPVEVLEIAGGHDKVMNEGGRADQYILDPDELPSRFQDRKQVSGALSLFPGKGKNPETGQNLTRDPSPESTPLRVSGRSVTKLGNADR